MKKTTYLVTQISFAGLMSIGLAGVALADSVSLDATGPNSNNQVTIDNSVTTSTTNTNVVTVTNSNDQVAVSGDVGATNNTNVGGAGSGNATNNNSTSTSVTVDNGGNSVTPTPPPANGGGMGAGSGSGTGSGSGGGTGSGSGGNVLGASTGGLGGAAETLPAVGASVPMDVSALRALYHPVAAVTPTATLVSHSSKISVMFLAVASILSLIGAAVSAIYSTHRSRQIV
ncbi:hypothetical protein HJC99_02620 [Candidatus Saccharibacteria bacterium]|nr:hypothetical protein [Candidatus Saccharibacteria bacterium]